MELTSRILSPTLAGLAVLVHPTPIAGQTVSEVCGVYDAAGYFNGIATSQQTGRLDVSLNLRCGQAGYDGELVTPLGTFPITEGVAASNHVSLDFAIGTELGRIEATLNGGRWKGSFAVAGDSGTLALSRIGEPRAPGWLETQLELAAPEWREDVRFFARTIAAQHGDAFHWIPKPRFDSLVALLMQRLDSLSGDQVFVELDRLANLIGDAHTFIAIPSEAQRFPFAVRRFGADYRITAVLSGTERLLGTRLVKVQEVPTSVAIQRLWPLTPAREHESLRQARAEGFLSWGMILHGLGITPTRDAVTLTLADDRGHEFQKTVRASERDTAADTRWKEVFAAAPLFVRYPEKSFWYQYLPKAQVVYCSFRGYDSLASRARGLLTLLDGVRPDKLIIDMRQNGGGDYELGLRSLIEPLSRRRWINRRGRLFVAIGPNTYSAAMANAAQFRTRTNALLVGETIGEKPNSFQEPREVRLPNSHLILRYSTKYYRFVDRGPNAVEPDHRVAPTWDEYRQGHDPVLEWILRFGDSSAATDSGGSGQRPRPNMRMQLTGAAVLRSVR